MCFDPNKCAMLNYTFQAAWLLTCKLGFKMKPTVCFSNSFHYQNQSHDSDDFMAWTKYIPVWKEFLLDTNPSVQVWNDSIPDWNRIIPDQTIISWQIYYISAIKGDRKKLTSG